MDGAQLRENQYSQISPKKDERYLTYDNLTANKMRQVDQYLNSHG